MKRKYILILMQFLTLICMLSIGFSSWTIVSPPIIAEGNITAENVLSYKDVIDFDLSKDTDSKIDGIKVFEYYSGGILDSNGNLTDHAKCTVYLKIDLDKYLEVFYAGEEYNETNTYSSNIKLTLGYLSTDSYNIFQEEMIVSILPNANYNTNNVSQSKINNMYILSFNMSNILSSYDASDEGNNIIYLEVEYDFIIDRINFINNTYPALKNDYEFILDVKMEAIK